MHCTSGVPGTVRIIKERFVELFLLKFAQSVNVSSDYEIIFNDIDECPPKVTVTVTSNRSYSNIQRMFGAGPNDQAEVDITNVISGILESEDPFE